VASEDTKRRILETAVDNFGRRGYEGTRLRELIEAAGVNQAAVNYHFGSKEGLYRAILHEYAGTLRARRRELLDAVLHDAGTGKPAVADVLRALIEPFFEMRETPGGEVIQRFFEQFITERHEFIANLYRSELKPTAELFIAALQRALPHVPRAAICRAYAWAVRLMAQGAGDVIFGVLSEPDEPSPPPFEVLFDFCVGGFERLDLRYSRGG